MRRPPSKTLTLSPLVDAEVCVSSTGASTLVGDFKGLSHRCDTFSLSSCGAEQRGASAGVISGVWACLSVVVDLWKCFCEFCWGAILFFAEVASERLLGEWLVGLTEVASGQSRAC